MREIKFKSWDIKGKEFIDYWCGNSNDTLNEIFSNEPFIFLQYTGLKDKNGKEIYEGDIVYGARTWKQEEFTYEVKYQPDDDWAWNFPTGLCNSLEVIGNIYENPELVKEEK